MNYVIQAVIKVVVGETGVVPLTFTKSRIFSIRYDFVSFQIIILLAFISVHQDLQKFSH